MGAFDLLPFEASVETEVKGSGPSSAPPVFTHVDAGRFALLPRAGEGA